MPTEFELIARYFTRPAAHAVLGVGDDAALIRAGPGMELAVSTDMLVCGTHFVADADPRKLGHKALAVNLSDMAAMGAVPRWTFLALALPKAEPKWLRSFSAGFLALARAHGTELVGGDTTRGPLNVCVTIIGEVPRGLALRRDHARPGDDIWVSGVLGTAALALAHQQNRVELPPAEAARCMRALDRPQPRVQLGIALRSIARAAIDVSDGLAADLGHICERSSLGADVWLDRIPRPRVLSRLAQPELVELALVAGGDDYELCFTAPVGRRAAIAALSTGSDCRSAESGPCAEAEGFASSGKTAAQRTIVEAGSIISANRIASLSWRFVLSRPAHGIALLGGVGLIRFAPGTFGTLAAFPLHFWLSSIVSTYVHLGLLVALFLIGIWASGRTAHDLGVPDHGGIVCDETVAFLVVLFFTPADRLWQAFAFLVFRLFDIFKPQPIRHFDRTVHGGFGVMFDDLLAAGYTLLLLAVAKALID